MYVYNLAITYHYIDSKVTYNTYTGRTDHQQVRFKYWWNIFIDFIQNIYDSCCTC